MIYEDQFKKHRVQVEQAYHELQSSFQHIACCL